MPGALSPGGWAIASGGPSSRQIKPLDPFLNYFLNNSAAHLANPEARLFLDYFGHYLGHRRRQAQGRRRAASQREAFAHRVFAFPVCAWDHTEVTDSSSVTSGGLQK